MDHQGTSQPPPPLPPRGRPGHTEGNSHMDDPPAYEAIAHQERAFEKAAAPAGLARGDPRSSSQQSLSPEPQHEKRKLLLVYIHGFMGNETSFRSFPAHVHNLLVVLLAQTHVVHTKIYPRYQSKGKITIASEEFSKWIEPHQDASTDTVLLGHSMGGLLCAEVALMPSTHPLDRPLKHRTTGTVNFDVPFLGMHHGVVKSGLSSIFKPGDEPQDMPVGPAALPDANSEGDDISNPSAPGRVDTLWGQSDPNYNPSFANDVIHPVRKGWRSAWHFINKHSDDLTKATKKLVSSHMEFGGAMANYNELKTRYARLRALEEIDGRVRQSVVDGGVPARVRFVNYYTASTGRFKKPRSPKRHETPSASGSRSSSRHSSSDQRPALQAMQSNDSRASVQTGDQQWDAAMESLKIGGSVSASAPKAPSSTGESSLETTQTAPALPAKPPPLNVDYIEDHNVRKLVEQEHARAVKAYEEAVSQHDKRLADDIASVQSRRRSPEAALGNDGHAHESNPTQTPPPASQMTQSEREELRLANERQRMAREGRRMRGEPELEPEAQAENVPGIVTPLAESRRPSTLAPTLEATSTSQADSLAPVDSRADPLKPKKDRKFCTLPPKDSNGERDPCWVRVFMENMDEVSAHCGLFFVDERYERLVGDVASRIEMWIRDDGDLVVSQAM